MATIASHSPVVSDKSDEKSELEYQKIIAEFQPKKLCDSVNLFYNVQKETELSKATVEASRLLDINVDHIKQYRGVFFLFYFCALIERFRLFVSFIFLR